ncbi:MAG TPA: hypothetical protein VMU33_02600 [Burkholderiaceae bacterium]|nr:hypothetical protein [Burkholderiaceae bacterium]
MFTFAGLQDVLPLSGGLALLLLLLAALVVARRRGKRRHQEAIAREERALQALSLLRDSRLVPPTMEPAVEIFNVDEVLGLTAAKPGAAGAQAATSTGQGGRPAAAGEPLAAVDSTLPMQDTLGVLDAGSDRPLVAAQHGGFGASQPDSILQSLGHDAASAATDAPQATSADRQRLGAGVPLRELALVWFEARGYVASPASDAVRPIECVLRHRTDPARAYAFVALDDGLGEERGIQLIERAHGIGLERLLVTTDERCARATKRALRKRGLRVVDRDSIQDALSKMDFRVAARIVAVAAARTAHPVS